MRFDPIPARPLSARTALRDATRDEHERVDRAFGRYDLSEASDYRTFLAAQARAYLPIEAALDQAGATCVVPDWADRRRGGLLVADLAELAAAPGAPIAAPALADCGAIAGAIYVLEGSRLGGAMLRGAVPEGLPVRFLAAPAHPEAWRSFLLLLDRILTTPARLDAAIHAARAVFDRFERAALALEFADGR